MNECTAHLFEKYKSVDDFAGADVAVFAKEISSVTFFQSKAAYVTKAAQIIRDTYHGEVPHTIAELMVLPGVAYKTANVVLGELFNVWEGIPTDTHVRRFALRFDLTDNTDLTKISKDLEALVPKKDWKYVNNGLVLYGRYVCPARPHDCTEHPLTKLWPIAAERWPKAK